MVSKAEVTLHHWGLGCAPACSVRYLSRTPPVWGKPVLAPTARLDEAVGLVRLPKGLHGRLNDCAACCGQRLHFGPV